MNPYPQDGSPSQEQPASRNAEFTGGVVGSGGSAHTVQQDVNSTFQPSSVLTPYATPNGQTPNDFQRSMMLSAYHY